MISLHDQIQSQLCSFGTRLQELRLRHNWTLQELADRSGLSKAFLCRLESGDRQASIAAVLSLSRIFGVSLASLFESDIPAEPCVIVRRAEGIEHKAKGLTYVPLSKTNRLFNLQPMRVKVSRTRRGVEHYHHEGEEWVYVLSGLLTVSLAGRTYELAPGDAAHFDSRLPHRLIARGGGDVELLLVASLLSQSASGTRATTREARAIPSMEGPGFSSSKSNRKTFPAGQTAQKRGPKIAQQKPKKRPKKDTYEPNHGIAAQAALP